MMNAEQKRNAILIDNEMFDIGFTNKFLRAGVLAVAMKESGLMPRREDAYNTTPNARIRKIFGASVARFSDAQLNALKADPKAFFNHVYSAENNRFLGNRRGTDDGFNFRGWGFNQNTGFFATKRIGDHFKLDLINKPDLLDDPSVCAKALAFYYRVSIVHSQNVGIFQRRYNFGSTRQIADLATGTHLAHWTNAGFGILPENDPTGGWKTVQSYAPGFLDWIEGNRL